MRGSRGGARRAASDALEVAALDEEAFEGADMSTLTGTRPSRMLCNSLLRPTSFEISSRKGSRAADLSWRMVFVVSFIAPISC